MCASGAGVTPLGGLFKRGVNVLRVGICDAELPYSMEAAPVRARWTWNLVCRRGALAPWLQYAAEVLQFGSLFRASVS